MRNRRTFTKEFKRQIVEKILKGKATRAGLSRKHKIAYPVLYRWNKQYADGKLDNELSAGAYHQKEKIAQLERMVGRLTMENEVLRKALGSV